MVALLINRACFVTGMAIVCPGGGPAARGVIPDVCWRQEFALRADTVIGKVPEQGKMQPRH